jgi:hypothetical protein
MAYLNKLSHYSPEETVKTFVRMANNSGKIQNEYTENT